MNESDLIQQARNGAGEAFERLTQPYRRELQVHCYRMLGSLHDAEDTLQETLLAAWQHLGDFENRSSLRTWLYRIATNKCLDARRSGRRRPTQGWNVPGVDLLEPSRLGEVVWLEPYPETLLEGLGVTALGPEARYELHEAISLAFVTALQVLPPRQVAVLILRDVLGFRAAEVAVMLDSTVDSVTSALKRARAGLRHRWTPDRERPVRPPSPDSAYENEVVIRFVRAWESADVDALISLLAEDVTISMPPMPYEYVGRDHVARFCAGLFDGGRRFHLIPSRANGQPAFGVYLRTGAEVSDGVGLYVLSLAGDRIDAMVRFEGDVLATFALPSSIPGRGPAA